MGISNMKITIGKMRAIATKILKDVCRPFKKQFNANIQRYLSYRFYKRIQINHKLEIFEDRRSEVMEYCNISEEAIDHTLNDIKESMKDSHKSELNPLDDKNLINRYARQGERKAVSHMLRYTRFDKGIELVSFFNKIFKKTSRNKIRVLDYGCGVADYGISFGVYGYGITLSDIDGGVIEFSKWRFKKRTLQYSYIPVTENNMYPKLGEQDVIIAGEVLEHIRDPLRTVRSFHDALPSGGYLWVSAYPFKEKSVGGGHLKEAFDARSDVLKYLNGNFEKIKISTGYLLQKQ